MIDKNKSIKVYLVPMFFGGFEDILNNIPFGLKGILGELDGVVAENARTVKSRLQMMVDSFNKFGDMKVTIKENLKVLQWDEHSRKKDLDFIFSEIEKGGNWGIVSEAGMPCVADPGAEIVRKAHEKNIEVVPFVGPNSILLALVASGLNGQNFCFHGYLSRDQKERINELKKMEKMKGTQIFIETPYRKEAVFKDILDNLNENTDVCVALDLGMKSEFVKTLKMREWRRFKIDLKKRLGVFLVGGMFF